MGLVLLKSGHWGRSPRGATVSHLDNAKEATLKIWGAGGGRLFLAEVTSKAKEII